LSNSCGCWARQPNKGALQILRSIRLRLHWPRSRPRAGRPWAGQARVVNLPDLKALRAGDVGAWDDAFAWLWPAAFRAARPILERHLPAEVEGVAIQAIEELVEEVKQVVSVEELKPLVASIAHNLAVSRLREHFAAKRGGGQTESLEARQEDCGDVPEAIAADSPVAALERKELAERLQRLLAALK